MPLYDIHADDGSHATTCEGLELDGPNDVRSAILSSFPDMVRDTMPNGDHRTMRVSATDEAGRTVYSATLTLEGRWGSSV